MAALGRLGAARLPSWLHRRALCAVLTPAQRDLRQRQRGALQRLEQALVRVQATPEHLEVLRESLTLLDSLFLCCVVGEFNAGKSALINALLGRNACAEGVLPTTASVCLLKHPDVPFEPLAAHSEFAGVGGAAGITVMDVPGVEWLRSIHLVDTPGTNSIDEAHTALTSGFLPRADLVLFVTSSERPFSESEQRFMGAVAGWRKQVLCVLNKADLLPPDQLGSVVEYVRANADRVVRNAGGGKPVFVHPVSARTVLALKARAGSKAGGEGGGAAGRLELGAPLQGLARNEAETAAARQWEMFEAEMRGVLQDGARLKMMSQLATASRLRELYSRVEEQNDALARADADAVAQARDRIKEFEATTRADFDAQVARAQLVLAQLGVRGHKFLQQELTLSQLPRLLSRERFVTRFEKAVVADVSAQLERVALALADWMDQRAQAQARDTLAVLQARLHRPPARGGGGPPVAGGASSPGGEVWDETVAQLTEAGYASRRHELLISMQRSARESMSAGGVSDGGERAVAAIQTSLAQVLVLEAGAVGLTGMVSLKAASLADLTGLIPVALLAATGLVVLPLQRYRLQTDLQRRVDELSASLDASLRAHLEEELQRAASRCRDVAAPFARLVEREAAAHGERRRGLDRCAEELEKLMVQLMKAGAPMPGGSPKG
jgi:GTP-binding protein EngB required for normal cell division